MRRRQAQLICLCWAPPCSEARVVRKTIVLGAAATTKKELSNWKPEAQKRCLNIRTSVTKRLRCGAERGRK